MQADKLRASVFPSFSPFLVRDNATCVPQELCIHSYCLEWSIQVPSSIVGGSKIGKQALVLTILQLI